MPHKTKAAQIGPMAVQLEVEFLDRLSEPVREKKAPSVSAIIRTALERYDFTNMVVVRTAQVMISVRLPADLRRSLKKTARAKHTSIGQLVRTAVEAYLPQLETDAAGQLEMPIIEAPSAAFARQTGQPAANTALSPPQRQTRSRQVGAQAGRSAQTGPAPYDEEAQGLTCHHPSQVFLFLTL